MRGGYVELAYDARTKAGDLVLDAANAIQKGEQPKSAAKDIALLEVKVDFLSFAKAYQEKHEPDKAARAKVISEKAASYLTTFQVPK